MDGAWLPESDAENRRGEANIGFLTAGLPAPASKAVLVDALAGARRAVASRRHLQQSLVPWLNAQIRLGGIRETSAVLAVLEMPEYRQEAAERYRREHPERAGALDQLLDVLGSAGRQAD